MTAMDTAASFLVGVHDFASFAKSPEARGASTVRHITEASVHRDGIFVILEMEGNAFLTHQVRRTAGALVEIGRGRMTTDGFRELIEHPTPGLAGPTLAPEGLCLEEVRYPDPGPFPAYAKVEAEASALKI